jgi:ribosome recycling factor
MIKETLADAESRMSKTMEALHRDLNTIRTGRISACSTNIITAKPARAWERCIKPVGAAWWPT